jgi:hypothetical protein
MYPKIKVHFPEQPIECKQGEKRYFQLQITNLGEDTLLISEINLGTPQSFLPDRSLFQLKIEPNECLEKTIGLPAVEDWEDPRQVKTHKMRILCNDPENLRYDFSVSFKLNDADIESIKANEQNIKIPFSTIVVKDLVRTGSGSRKYLVEAGGHFESGGGNELFIEKGGIADNGHIVYLKKGGICKSAYKVYYQDEADLKYFTKPPHIQIFMPKMAFEYPPLFHFSSYMIQRLPYIFFWNITFIALYIQYLTDFLTGQHHDTHNDLLVKWFSPLFGDATNIIILIFPTLLGLFTPNIIHFFSRYRSSGRIR